jgi:hypothetical protein
MNREQYHAARRAAFQAQQMAQSEIRSAGYADSPAWAQRQAEQRCQEIVERVPSPFCRREFDEMTRARNRRSRVLQILHDRKYALSNTHHQILTDLVQETLRIWKSFPFVKPAPLPQDRAPAQPDQLRRAA